MSGPKDRALRERAKRVLPNGMYGHLSAARALGNGFPQFYEKAEGAKVWDVDGKEYIDFMCSYGPIVLGHHNAAVEHAVTEQRKKGDCMIGPNETIVELSELLVSLTPGGDWCMFSKNGTDATTLALTISRATTNKRYLLVQRGIYHGAAPVWQPGRPGVLKEDQPCQVGIRWNDLKSVHDALDQIGDDFAGIIVSAFDYTWSHDMVMPTKEFAQGIRKICDERGALLILDDIRGGFRIHMGGSWAPLGVQPDITCYCKAIGNGYPIAAVVGSKRARVGAEKVFATGSYWFSSVPMAAAIATLKEMQRLDHIKLLEHSGRLFREGLQEQADKYGLRVKLTGPVQIPWMSFVGDTEEIIASKVQNFNLWPRPRATLWTNEACKRGVYLHPQHNWFLSVAHTPDVIRQALVATDEAFRIVAEKYPETQRSKL